MITLLLQQGCIIHHVPKDVQACAVMNGNTRTKDGMLMTLSMLHGVRIATLNDFHTKIEYFNGIDCYQTLTFFNHIKRLKHLCTDTEFSNNAAILRPKNRNPKSLLLPKSNAIIDTTNEFNDKAIDEIGGTIILRYVLNFINSF